MQTHSDDLARAHRALQLVLVQLRWLVGERLDQTKLYDILDRIEILPALLQESGRLGEFAQHVEDLASRYPEFEVAAEEAKLVSAPA